MSDKQHCETCTYWTGRKAVQEARRKHRSMEEVKAQCTVPLYPQPYASSVIPPKERLYPSPLITHKWEGKWCPCYERKEN